MTRLAAIVLLSVSPGAFAGDLSRACESMKAATVQVQGDFLLYAGESDVRIPSFRAGSGFYIDDTAVVTAHHVVARMDRIEVCGSDGLCKPVVSVVGWPEADLAVLRLGAGSAPAALKIGSDAGTGAEVVAAGYPGELGFVCGPGHVTGEVAGEAERFLLFEGTVAAEGSSGGPVAVVSKNARKISVVGTVSGATTVGSVRFNRAATLGPLVDRGLTGPSEAPATWRTAQPWTEERSVALEIAAGRAYWEDIQVPALQDVELRGPADGLCYGLYHPTGLYDVRAEPEPIGWTCDGTPVRYTTREGETVRIGLWSDAAAGFDGAVELRRR